MIYPLALLLLLSSWEPPDWLLGIPGVFPVLAQVARDEQIWCEWDGQVWRIEEGGECYVWRRDKRAALRTWRGRRRELAGAPRLEALRAFAPDREGALDRLRFARAYLDRLEAGRGLCRVRAWQYEMGLVREEVLYRMSLWDLLADAQCGFLAVPYRREALHRLRAELGPAFYLGVMPAVVPVEFFTRIDP